MPSGGGSGLTWWSMMYEEPPTAPGSGGSPGGGGGGGGGSTAAPGAAAASTTSSTSPASTSSNTAGQTGPLHIPAKRLGAGTTGGYDCPEPGVIRHSHPAPWTSYSESHSGFDPHQYNAPTYYNLPGEARDGPGGRKTGPLSFWSPAASSGYGTASAPSDSACQQGFSGQGYWNYGGRHPAAPEPPQPVPYLAPSEDRRAAVIAAESAGFPHDGYGSLRNYAAPEPVAAAPYPPPGESLPSFDT